MDDSKSKRMKILQLLHSLNTGGAEILAERFGRNFTRNYEVIFACLDGVGEIGERLLKDGFRVVELQRKDGIDRNCIKRLKHLIRNESVDLIHAHQYTPFFYAMAAQAIGRRKPILFTEHGRFLPDLPSHKRIFFNRLMLRKRDHIVAVGKDVKRALIENEGLPDSRIDVIYNGIPIDRFNTNSTNAKQQFFRESLGIPKSASVVVQVARLDYLKDHVTAVKALSLATQQTDIHLVIVGEGPERNKIENEIREQQIADRVHLVGLRNDIPDILREADILLLTSISEVIPLTLIEGMATGLPVVSTDVGGVAEVIRENESGFLCSAQDHKTIATRLATLTQSKELRRQFGENGKARAEANFSEKAMQKKYDALVSQMLQ